MADTNYSIRTFDGDGSTLTWPITFTGGYIYKTDVHAYTSTVDAPDLIPATFTWVGDNTIKIDPAVPTGTTLTLQRKTQKGSPIVDFNDLAVLSEDSLDLAIRQAILSIAEVDDTGGGSGGSSGYDALYTLINTEIVERQSADEAFVSTTTTLSATIETNKTLAHAEVVEEASARATAVSAEATARLALAAQLNDTNASVVAEANARATADSAEATARLALKGQVDDNTAAIVNEATLRVSGDSAVASTVDSLAVRVQTLEDTPPGEPDLTDVYAAITNEATVRADGDGALGTRIDNVTASVTLKTKTYYQSTAPSTGQNVGDIWYNTSQGNKPSRWNGSSWVDVSDQRLGSYGDSITTLTAGLAAEQTARANAVAAEATTRASAVAGLQSQVNTVNGQITNVNAAAVSETNARVNAVAAVASRTDNLEASFVSAGSQNLARNPDLRLMVGTTRPFGYVAGGAITGFTSRKYIGTGGAMVGGGESLLIQGSGYTTSVYSDLTSYPAEALVGVRAGTQYVFSAWCLAKGAAVRHLLYIQWLNDAGEVLLTSQSAAWLTGTGQWQRQSATGVAPASATNVRLYMRTTGNTTSPTGAVDVFWDWVQFEVGSVATGWRDNTNDDISSTNAAISNEAFVRANADSANATSIAGVSTTVGQHTASINTLNSSVNGLRLRYGVALNSNGYVTGVQGFTDGATSQWVWATGAFKIQGVGTTVFTPFSVDTVNNIVKMTNVEVDTLKINSVGSAQVQAGAISTPKWFKITGTNLWNMDTTPRLISVDPINTTTESNVLIDGTIWITNAHNSSCYLNIFRVVGGVATNILQIPGVQGGTQTSWPILYLDEDTVNGAATYAAGLSRMPGNSDPLIQTTYMALRATELKK